MEFVCCRWLKVLGDCEEIENTQMVSSTYEAVDESCLENVFVSFGNI
jgi:hypothetical protein